MVRESSILLRLRRLTRAESRRNRRGGVVLALSLGACAAGAGISANPGHVMPAAPDIQETEPALQDSIAIARIEQVVDSLMESQGIPGLSVAVSREGASWQRGRGYADVENRVPATPATSYALASLMKPMTAAATLQLAAGGRIDLDAEIQAYVPYYPRKRWPVTVRQVLGHLAGIGCRDFTWSEGLDKTPHDTRAVIALFKDCDLLFEPGTRFEYSSWGYDLLGALIEEVTGTSFGDYMSAHVWKTLGMMRTGLDTRDLVPDRARGYQLEAGVLRNAPYVDNSLWFAAGGGRSTVVDLVRFAHGLDEGKALSREAQRAMYTPMVTRDGQSTKYGMGWGIIDVAGRTAVYWMGSQPGTTTVLLRIPEKRIAVAMACNLGDRPMPMFRAALRCAEALLP